METIELIEYLENVKPTQYVVRFNDGGFTKLHNKQLRKLQVLVAIGKVDINQIHSIEDTMGRFNINSDGTLSRIVVGYNECTQLEIRLHNINKLTL